jgi:hypothetical protein
MDDHTRQRRDDWRRRISSSDVEDDLNHDRRLELTKYLWNEYQYRHDFVWRLVFRLTAAVVVLAVIPYTQGNVIGQIGRWIIVSPIFGVALAVIWSYRAKSELKHLDHIRNLYRPLQDSLFYPFPGDRKPSAFSKHIKVYLGIVIALAGLNVLFSFYILFCEP